MFKKARLTMLPLVVLPLLLLQAFTSSTTHAALSDNIPEFGKGQWLKVGQQLINGKGDENTNTYNTILEGSPGSSGGTTVVEEEQQKVAPQNRPAPSNLAKNQIRLHYGVAAVVDKVGTSRSWRRRWRRRWRSR